MTNLIDTHSHIYAEEFDSDREQVVRRAVEAGVGRMLLPAIDSESHERLFDTCRRYPARCFPMMGLHPTSVNENPRWREELSIVEEYLRQPPVDRFYAVGEIGLDFYWSRDFCQQQIEAFRTQLEWAIRYDLPVVIHTRSATEAMTEVVESFRGRGLRGIFHAFSESEEVYARWRAAGDFLFGIGGVVTFKKSALAETVRRMELSDLVLETDCPYLTPAPHRGERNESGYIPYICEKIAQLKGIPADEVARQTTRSAERMFGLGAAELDEDTNTL